MTIDQSRDLDLRNTSVVIAAYNEGRALDAVVAGLNELGVAVVVVDDGSSDDTAQVARASGAVVVQHPVNLGQGAALQTGIDFALRRNAQYIVTFDADGQHLASDVPVLLAALLDSGADIACGSRFLGRAENISGARRLLLKLATVFTFLTTGLRMTDAHNGLRAMTRSCASRIRIRQNRMAHASEIIGEIARHEFRFVEAPVTVLYSAYSLQKGQKLSNSVNIIVDLVMGKLHR